MKILSDENYYEEIHKDGIKLIYLKTPTCPACYELEGVLEAFDKEFGDKIAIYSCDITKNPKIAKKYEPRAVPMHFFVDNDKNIKFPEAGVKSIDYFIKKYEELTSGDFWSRVLKLLSR